MICDTVCIVTEGQVLDDWREFCLNSYTKMVKNIQHCPSYENSAYAACNTINEEVRQDVFLIARPISYPPPVKISTLLKIPNGRCDEYSLMAVAIMRAKGIACAIDFTPQWPFRSMGHSWNVMMENTGKMSIFEGCNGTIGSPHKKDHKMAKVFRRTYILNKELKELHLSEKYLPDAFRKPFIKDVTDEYMNTVDITLKTNHSVNEKFAYLAVFDDAQWVPVSWGKL